MDWNEDGNKDLLTGEYTGNIRIYLNTNTDSDPVFSGFTYLQVGGVKYKVVDEYSVPAIVDWNNDGKKDVLCAGGYGKVDLLLNEGTNAAPLFKRGNLLKDGTQTLVIGLRGNAFVCDFDLDGKKDLVGGEEWGKVFFYKNKGTDAAPAFQGGVKIAEISDYRARPALADWDNDGVLDILCGGQEGHVKYYHCLGPLSLSDNQIPETTGASIDFSLKAGTAHANRSYFILGSISGTEPGIDIPFGPHLPLNWDVFTDLVLAQANNPVLANFKSTLDAAGTGTAQFNTVGVMPAGLAGVVFSFAYLVYDPITSTIFSASNGTQLEVIP